MALTDSASAAQGSFGSMSAVGVALMTPSAALTDQVIRYPNPALSGFYPDPSVVKVGDDYYLANSTFEYLPGIPIFHSTDLVSWELVGHIVERPGQLASANIPTNGGAWAPTIRHRNGVFYVVVTDAMGRGMLIFTAERPEGPWSDGTVVQGVHGIDPDLAWGPDGTAYITYSGLDTTSGAPTGEHGGVLQVTVDLATGTPLSEPRALWSGTGLKFPEAPHLYFHDGYWYLMIAEGGTERGHGISLARSDAPDGPFESGPGNPLVSARSTSRPIQNTGHGDLVEAPDGSWAVIMLGMRPGGGTQAFSALGRETFITTARWEDGWLKIDPVQLSPGGQRSEEHDDFDSPVLEPQWLAIRRYPTELADLSETGRLQLHGDGSTLDDLRPVFLGRRQRHRQVAVSVTVDAGGGLGGLCVRFDERHHYAIEVGDATVTARAVVAGIRQEWSAPAPTGPVTLHLDCEPPTGAVLLDFLTNDIVVLAMTDPSGTRTEIARVDGRYLSQETAASFTGRVLGLYAVRGEVAFSAYRYVGIES
jgi:xylan 1,4-beta-xylosidase